MPTSSSVPLLAAIVAIVAVAIAACAPAAPPVHAPDAIVDAGGVGGVGGAAEEAPVPTVLAIVPRGDWDPAPLEAGVAYPNPKRLRDVYRRIVVHHSDFVEPPGPLGIKRYHLEVSGFSDIGYHYVIGPDGVVSEGRPLSRMGAHAGATREAGRNKALDPDWGSVGIVLDGHFGDRLPPRAQLAGLELLVADLQKRFPKIDAVVGHREVRGLVEARGQHLTSDPTTCPGDRLFAHLERRRMMASVRK